MLCELYLRLIFINSEFQRQSELWQMFVSARLHKKLRHALALTICTHMQCRRRTHLAAKNRQEQATITSLMTSLLTFVRTDHFCVKKNCIINHSLHQKPFAHVRIKHCFIKYYFFSFNELKKCIFVWIIKSAKLFLVENLTVFVWKKSAKRLFISWCY